jgi:hypothetical protein
MPSAIYSIAALNTFAASNQFALHAVPSEDVSQFREAVAAYDCLVPSLVN